MAIVEYHFPAKRPMRFMSHDAAKEAMKRRRTGPYEYERIPGQDKWFVIRRIDRCILCTDGKWREAWKVHFNG